MTKQGRPHVDQRKLGVYLDDHLAGAAAAIRRMRRTARTLAGTPAGGLLDQIADEVNEEKTELVGIIHDLGLRRSGIKQVLARVGEVAALVKHDRPLGRSQSMNTLLEVELLRSGVMGKRGLWQTLEVHVEVLGLDAVRCRYLAERSERQIATLDDVHAFVRARALLTPPS